MCKFISELCVCMCVSVYTLMCTGKMCGELSELAWLGDGWMDTECMKELVWGTKFLGQQKQWHSGKRPRDLTNWTSCTCEQHVRVNMDPWAERRGRPKAPGGSHGRCEGAERQSGPDSQAQKRGYTQPLDTRLQRVFCPQVKEHSFRYMTSHMNTACPFL